MGIIKTDVLISKYLIRLTEAKSDQIYQTVLLNSFSINTVK